MRHGQSKANVAGIIVSRIESDRHGDYGLSELGRTQALEAAQACDLPRDIVICSSDFSRARQTAEIVRAHLDAPGVDLAEALRERCFGAWEGSATDNYARVWAADESDSPQAGDGVEPTTVVLDRTTALIVDLERRYSGRHILLVSHGDTLQILQAGFLRMSPASHRSLPALQIAEIRQLRLSEEAAGNRLALRTPALGLVAHGFGAGGASAAAAPSRAGWRRFAPRSDFYAIDTAIARDEDQGVSRPRGPRGRPGPRRCRGRASPRRARGSSPLPGLTRSRARPPPQAVPCRRPGPWRPR